jgi:hypothetical protein
VAAYGKSGGRRTGEPEVAAYGKSGGRLTGEPEVAGTGKRRQENGQARRGELPVEAGREMRWPGEREPCPDSCLPCEAFTNMLKSFVMEERLLSID